MVWQKKSLNGLCISHMNVHFLINKTDEVSSLLDKPNKLTHIIGLSETRLSKDVDNDSLFIQNYSTPFRRDIGSHPKHRGLAFYVHDSIRHIVSRRADLEHEPYDSFLYGHITLSSWKTDPRFDLPLWALSPLLGPCFDKKYVALACPSPYQMVTNPAALSSSHSSVKKQTTILLLSLARSHPCVVCQIDLMKLLKQNKDISAFIWRKPKYITS